MAIAASLFGLRPPNYVGHLSEELGSFFCASIGGHNRFSLYKSWAGSAAKFVGVVGKISSS